MLGLYILERENNSSRIIIAWNLKINRGMNG